MNDTSTPAAVADTKTIIRPKLENYVRAKSAGGKRTHRTDDLTARTLAGKDLNAIKQGANILGIDHTKWNHVNVGQQRMLIGNAIRHLLKDEKSSVTEATLRDVFGEPAAPYDAEAAAAEAAAKAEAAAAKKAEKEAKARDAQAAKEAKLAGSGELFPEKTHSTGGKSKAGKK